MLETERAAAQSNYLFELEHRNAHLEALNSVEESSNSSVNKMAIGAALVGTAILGATCALAPIATLSLLGTGCAIFLVSSLVTNTLHNYDYLCKRSALLLTLAFSIAAIAVSAILLVALTTASPFVVIPAACVLSIGVAALGIYFYKNR